MRDLRGRTCRLRGSDAESCALNGPVRAGDLRPDGGGDRGAHPTCTRRPPAFAQVLDFQSGPVLAPGVAMHFPKNAAFALTSLALLACGGDRHGKTGTTAGSTVSSTTPMRARYATADGTVHLVLDRTGAKAKLRVDGTKDIIELTQEEVRQRNSGQLAGYDLVAPDGKRRVFLSVDGELTYMRGRDELPLVREGEANALGPATVVGSPPPPPPKEKSPNELAAAELRPISVTARLPRFKPEDSGNLAKVAEAFALVTKDMLMTCGDTCGAWYAPHPVAGGNGHGGLGFVQEKELRQGPATEEEKKGPLAKYNAWIRADYDFGDWTHAPIKNAWLATFQLEFRKLEPKTPVIVWDVDAQNEAILVTLDGARYWESTASNGKPVLARGIAAPSEWPAPLRNNLLFADHVAELDKRGLVDRKSAEEVADIHAKFDACAKKTFLPAQKELEGNLTYVGAHFYTATNRNAVVLRRYNEKTMRECGGNRVALVYAHLLADREAGHRAIWEKNKARLPGLAK